jgi:hypothetical protein
MYARFNTTPCAGGCPALLRATRSGHGAATRQARGDAAFGSSHLVAMDRVCVRDPFLLSLGFATRIFLFWFEHTGWLVFDSAPWLLMDVACIRHATPFHPPSVACIQHAIPCIRHAIPCNRHATPFHPPLPLGRCIAAAGLHMRRRSHLYTVSVTDPAEHLITAPGMRMGWCTANRRRACTM